MAGKKKAGIGNVPHSPKGSRASNFRGTKKTLYNPRTVKYLDPDTARKEYQSLREIALKRQKRLREAELEPEIASFELPPSSLLQDPGELQQALLDVSNLLRNPQSVLFIAKKVNKEKMDAVLGTLAKPGDKEIVRGKSGRFYKREVADLGEVINKNRKAFGDFMEDMRARAGGRIRNSDRVRLAYEEAVKRRMRPKTLEKHFNKWMLDSDKVDKLAQTLEKAPKSGRLTIAQLEELLGPLPKEDK
jgi:hypothetical protein